jgi:hypothetical protein
VTVLDLLAAEQGWSENAAVRIVGGILGLLLIVAAIRAMFRK